VEDEEEEGSGQEPARLVTQWRATLAKASDFSIKKHGNVSRRVECQKRTELV
jgi:hypothetical protein